MTNNVGEVNMKIIISLLSKADGVQAKVHI